MSQPKPSMASSDPMFCRATLNYVAAGTATGEQVQPVEVTVHDGRRAPLPSWQVCGFELMQHASAVRDWDDDLHLTNVHHAEMAAYAKALTGCDHALVSGHIKRNPQQAALHPDLGPIHYVHSDFAPSYGERMREFYRGPRQEANQALAREGISAATVSNARRMLILQFWRNVGPARMDRPLAFCDSRTVAADDVRAYPVQNYAGGGFDFDTLGVLATPHAQQHLWYAFPDMQVDEVVAFRTFDSEQVANGTAFWTPHSAFHDPRVPIGQPSRRSIELRATCLFV